MQRSISRDELLPSSSPAGGIDAVPKVSSMVSLLHLDDDTDIEDMAKPEAKHTPDHREQIQSKAMREIYQSSPRVSVAFSKSQTFLCPNCRLPHCRASRPPSGYYSKQQISQHDKPGDCWIVANGVVYDVSRYLVKHPGGIETILSRAGRDASRDFDFHTESGKRVWKKLAVGKLAECDQDQHPDTCMIM